MVRPLHLEPNDKLEFRGDFNGPMDRELRIRNRTGKRQCYKLKSSDNSLFKIRPWTGFVKHGALTKATVTFVPREKGKKPSPTVLHHISLYEFPAKIKDTTDKSPQEIWSTPDAKARPRKKKLRGEFRLDGEQAPAVRGRLRRR